MKYKVRYWMRTFFDEKDVFVEEVEANSEEEAIKIINSGQGVMSKHTQVLSGKSTIKEVLDNINEFHDKLEKRINL